MYRYLRPSMLQHLLRRLVFDVPILNEYAKMPLKVCYFAFCVIESAGNNPTYTDLHYYDVNKVHDIDNNEMSAISLF